MADDAPSRRVVEQRVRNRIIEYLDLAASYAKQADYAAAAPPFVNVPSEVINQWQDWVPLDPRTDPNPMHVLSAHEIRTMCDFHATWEVVADAVPNDHAPLSTVQELPEWDLLRRAATQARAVFAVRGAMPEDHESEALSAAPEY
jgi:anaerobic glycerol-3-phosphate dehydrogenase